MKALIFFFFIASPAFAGPWVGPSQVNSYFQRVLPFIEDSKARQQAEQALQTMTQAEHSDGFKKGVLELSKVDAPAAKVAALYFYTDRETRESFSASLHFTLPDLAVILSWMVTNGITFGESLNTESTFGKLECIDVLAGKVNDILSSKNMPNSRRQNSRDGEGWLNYTSEELRNWALEQVNWSLKNKAWSSEEKDFLTKMMTKLKSAELPPLVRAPDANVALIDLNLSNNTISKPSNSIRQLPTSSLTELISQDHGVILWLAAILAALGGVWVLMRKGSR